MVPMVVVVAIYGFFLGKAPETPLDLLFLSLFGMSLVSLGSASLNNYLEKDVDAQMERTKGRPLPTGRISPKAALVYGISMVITGVFVLVFWVNLLTGFLLLLASFLYVLVYTPLKRWSTWNTFVGAIPGAIPAMAGWAAATGEVGAGAWILFFILFTWQHPHFYAIAIMYEDDYRRGGFKMLPVVEPDHKSTYRQIIVYSILLLLVSVLPYSLGLMGSTYLVGAILLGVMMLVAGMVLIASKTLVDARKLFHASLIYLPGLLLLIVVDFSLRTFL